MYLDDEDVREILRLIDASPYDGLQIETDEFKLILRRTTGESAGWTQETIFPETQAAGKAGGEEGAAEAPSAAQTTSEDGVADIRPPLVGTFYRAPKPGAPPFVEVGSQVEEDTTICIIETMKLMNTVRAGVKGEVIEIRAENGTFVESDAILMRVRVAES